MRVAVSVAKLIVNYLKLSEAYKIIRYSVGSQTLPSLIAFLL